MVGSKKKELNFFTSRNEHRAQAGLTCGPPVSPDPAPPRQVSWV